MQFRLLLIQTYMYCNFMLDYSFSKSRFFVSAGCPTLPKQPDPGWTQYGGYQYKFMYFSYSWTSARQSCHRYGADLMVHGIQDYSRRRYNAKFLLVYLGKKRN